VCTPAKMDCMPRNADPPLDGVTQRQRHSAARIAREMAEKLLALAATIEAAEDPSVEVGTVIRVRGAVRAFRWKPETYARLSVLEAVHRGRYYAERYSGESLRAATLTTDSLAVVVARDLFADVAFVDCSFTFDATVWLELMDAWRTGQGAPKKTAAPRVDRPSKWDRLANILARHLKGAARVSGRTLESEWRSWTRGSDHLSSRTSRHPK
jgi:hypothetical protein